MDFQEYGYFDSEIVGYDEEGFPILDRAQTVRFSRCSGRR